jgi:hypothetical protein
MFVVGGHIDATSAAIAFSDGAGDTAHAFSAKGRASASLVTFAAVGVIALGLDAEIAASGEIGQTEALSFGALFALWAGLGIAAFGGGRAWTGCDKEPEQRPCNEPTNAVFSREKEERGRGKRGGEERKCHDQTILRGVFAIACTVEVSSKALFISIARKVAFMSHSVF